MEYTISEICQILKLPNGKQDTSIQELLVDSRKLIYPGSTLFIALKTSLRDGHQFIPELYEKGVRNFLVTKSPDHKKFPDANFLIVKDTLRALQTLAAFHRKKFTIPTIGITGSNGKTIVKEWLYQLLKNDFHIVRSPKSFNSQIGVPLSVWQMEPNHEMAIFEAGISQPDEMIHLEKVIRPTIGIFSHIGEAHAEGFKELREKIREKLLLFTHTDLLIYGKDHPLLDEEILKLHHQSTENKTQGNKPLQLMTWSYPEMYAPTGPKVPIQDAEPDLKVIHINPASTDETGVDAIFTRIDAAYKGKQIYIQIPFSDSGSIENALHCWCLLLRLNLSDELIRRRMKQLAPIAMRLEMKQAVNNCSLINDSYNSDLGSLAIALDFLQRQKQQTKHTLVLSDILQSGRKEKELYETISGLLEQKKVDRLIGIGKHISTQQAVFERIKKLECTFYPDTDAFIKELIQVHDQGQPLPFQNEVILLKGARPFGFERISKLLEKKMHQTVLEIDLNALIQNLKTYQNLLNPGVLTMVMVKAFSYGSGSFEIANLLQYHRVDFLAVANVDEGIELRQKGISLPIMVMNPEPHSFHALIQWKLAPEIYSLRLFNLFLAELTQRNIEDYPIHIKLDTGMHRLGFSEKDISGLLRILGESKAVKVISIFSHLAASYDPAMVSFTYEQAKHFDSMSQTIIRALPYSPLRHLANTSAISRYPGLQYDMVRLGIGLYGIDHSPLVQNKLQVVNTLKTSISQIKNVPKGETIGYGRAGGTEEDKVIATVSIGYADGYLRTLGQGKGYMMIRGKRAYTIGHICMDMLMLDVTHIPDIREGDTVLVFGEDPRLEEVAQKAGTIPYEIMAGISQRVKRVYVQE